MVVVDELYISPLWLAWEMTGISQWQGVPTNDYLAMVQDGKVLHVGGT